MSRKVNVILNDMTCYTINIIVPYTYIISTKNLPETTSFPVYARE